jgi:hypothetical protein
MWIGSIYQVMNRDDNEVISVHCEDGRDGSQDHLIMIGFTAS